MPEPDNLGGLAVEEHAGSDKGTALPLISGLGTRRLPMGGELLTSISGICRSGFLGQVGEAERARGFRGTGVEHSELGRLPSTEGIREEGKLAGAGA